MKLDYSFELMQSFVQGSTIDPSNKFQAVQDPNGRTLFFSISSDKKLYAIRQAIRGSKGWKQFDLTPGLTRFFPRSNVTVKNFAVGQQADMLIDLAVVVSVNGVDNVVIALNNATDSSQWLGDGRNGPQWRHMKYDDPAFRGANPVVRNIMISSSDSHEFVVVDIERLDGSREELMRYFIDPYQSFSQTQKWFRSDFPVDIDSGTSTSVFGRAYRNHVDGVYTLGKVLDDEKIVYVPLYDYFDRTVPPSPIRLNAPRGSSAIALANLTSSQFTDLFVAAQGALYYFPASSQRDRANPVRIVENEIFDGVDTMEVDVSHGKVSVWGINRHGSIFYTECETNSVVNPGSWSYPLPLQSNVVDMATYINRKTGENVFFANSGDGVLHKAVQSMRTQYWSVKKIVVDTAHVKTQKMLAYHTRIQVSDESGEKNGVSTLSVSSTEEVSVYVGEELVEISEQPTFLETDATGGLTIVEETDNRHGHRLNVSIPNSQVSVSINPEQGPSDKLLGLDSVEKLRQAVVKSDNVSDEDVPLIPQSTPDRDLQAIAGFVGKLNRTKADLQNALNDRNISMLEDDFMVSLGSFGIIGDLIDKGIETVKDFGKKAKNFIKTAAGDAFRYIKDKAVEAFNVVKDAATGAWNAVCRIAGKAFTWVVDTVEKAVDAIEFVLNEIKVGVGKVINYMKFIFQWNDIIFTKDVMKSVFLSGMKSTASSAEGLKEEIMNTFEDARGVLSRWGGVNAVAWNQVDNSGRNLDFVSGVMKVGEILSAPVMWLFNQVISKFIQIRVDDDGGPSVNEVESMLNTLVGFLRRQGNIFETIADQISSEVLNNISSISVREVVQKVVAILGNAFLSSAENLCTAIFDVLIIISRSFMKFMNARIRFGFLSDILETFGINFEFSLLDIICLVGAAAATISYKAVTGKAPFSKSNPFHQSLKQGEGIDALTHFTSFSEADAVPVVFCTQHFSGIASFISAVVVPIVEANPSSEDVGLGKVATIANSVSTAFSFVSKLFYSPFPVENEIMSQMSLEITVLQFLCSLAAFKVKEEDVQKAILKASMVLSLLSLIPSSYHFDELTDVASGFRKSNSIITETCNVALVCKDVAVCVIKTTEGQAKLAAMGATAVTYGINGGLCIANSAVYLGNRDKLSSS